MFAVREALQHVPGEVIVIDNASTDGSRDYLEPRFPDVTFIWNKENLGFGRANNKAALQAKGDILLFLNPDTIIGEYCLEKTTEFLSLHKDAGALGIRMINGAGRYLKESKRAYPSLFTSFYKLSGLAAIFPRSRWFAKYYLGHLHPRQNHEVDVLAGAFMMVKRDVFEKTGGFDERFFMYGEDIDLSYRIKQAGYKNYYFAEETIIHFKGESTRRSSLNYIKMFYSAMIIFVDKHYTGWGSRFFKILLKTAIVTHGTLAYIREKISFGWSKQKNTLKNDRVLAVVGNKEEAEQVGKLFMTGKHIKLIQIPPDQLKNIQKSQDHSPGLQDLVLCKGPLTNTEIIRATSLLPQEINIRFHAMGSSSLIGSDSSKMNGVTLSVL